MSALLLDDWSYLQWHMFELHIDVMVKARVSIAHMDVAIYALPKGLRKSLLYKAI